LINKIWNSVAIAFLNKDPKSSLLVKLTKPHPTLEEFYFAMKNAPKFPISFFHFDVQTLVNWPDLKKFFKEFGLNIRVLVLKVASGKEVNENEEAPNSLVEQYRRMLRIIFKYVKSLCSLFIWYLPKEVCSQNFVFTEDERRKFRLRKLNYLELGHYVESWVSPEFLKGLITMTPNLKQLGLCGGKPMSTIIPEAINGTEVEEIQCEDGVSYGGVFWNKLTEQESRFKVLMLTITSKSEAEKNMIQAFFESQSDVLEELRLSSSRLNNDGPRHNVGLPPMRKLLEISLDHINGCTFALNQFRPDQLPKLKVVNACTVCFDNTFNFNEHRRGRKELRKERRTFDTVEEFNIKSPNNSPTNCLENASSLRALSYIFPKLKRLRVDLDPNSGSVYFSEESLQVIFEKLRELEELDLYISNEHLSTNINLVLGGCTSDYAWLAERFLELAKVTPEIGRIKLPKASLLNMKRKFSNGEYLFKIMVADDGMC
jgi:hypothetical protein